MEESLTPSRPVRWSTGVKNIPASDGMVVHSIMGILSPIYPAYDNYLCLLLRGRNFRTVVLATVMPHDRSGSEEKDEDSVRDNVRSVYLMAKQWNIEGLERHAPPRSVYFMPADGSRKVEKTGHSRGKHSKYNVSAKSHDEECVREKRKRKPKKKTKSKRIRRKVKTEKKSSSSEENVRDRNSGSKESKEEKKDYAENSSSERARKHEKRKKGASRRKLSKGKNQPLKPKKSNSVEIVGSGENDAKADDEDEPAVGRTDLSAKNLQRAIELVNRHREAERRKEEERQRREAGASVESDQNDVKHGAVPTDEAGTGLLIQGSTKIGNRCRHSKKTHLHKCSQSIFRKNFDLQLHCEFIRGNKCRQVFLKQVLIETSRTIATIPTNYAWAEQRNYRRGIICSDDGDNTETLVVNEDQQNLTYCSRKSIKSCVFGYAKICQDSRTVENG
ncbi:hypothetical protein RB195_005383 [Necator americanus]|uniref:Uncharacterized protein n=1 Tax=Necator americanus TaxID=51031 RepID=A0ABR1BQI3_NECAM